MKRFLLAVITLAFATAFTAPVRAMEWRYRENIDLLSSGTI